ncbi:hypothetical protein PF005_g21669, partial [Phytophthora fragariae]
SPSGFFDHPPLSTHQWWPPPSGWVAILRDTAEIITYSKTFEASDGVRSISSGKSYSKA